MFEFAGHDIGEDLHLAVRMRPEARAWLDTILVDHS